MTDGELKIELIMVRVCDPMLIIHCVSTVLKLFLPRISFVRDNYKDFVFPRQSLSLRLKFINQGKFYSRK